MYGTVARMRIKAGAFEEIQALWESFEENPIPGMLVAHHLISRLDAAERAGAIRGGLMGVAQAPPIGPGGPRNPPGPTPPPLFRRPRRRGGPPRCPPRPGR